MSETRLKEIKKDIARMKDLYAENDYPQGDQILYSLQERHLDWLVQQAEKEEYWMKQHRKRCNELEDAYFKIQLIENQLQRARDKAERYKQALEYYGYEAGYTEDHGVKARKALEGEE